MFAATTVPFWHSSRRGAAAIATSGVVLFLGLGCAESVLGTQPDDMGAEAHRQEASEHAARGRTLEHRYDARVRSPEVDARRYPQEFDAYDPTAVYLRLAQEHQRHALEHLEAARILENFEEAECAAFPPETRVLCPLIGQVDAVEDIPGGVRIHLTEGVPLHAAAAHMRCHLAFARARGHIGMQECPLYLRGVRVGLTSDSEAVDLLVADPIDAETLRSRTHRHLEK